MKQIIPYHITRNYPIQYNDYQQEDGHFIVLTDSTHGADSTG